MKDFFIILNHLLQTYIVSCTSLLFKEKNRQFTGGQVCSKANFFCFPGLLGWPGKRDYIEKFQPG